MKRKILTVLLCMGMAALTGCGNSDMMVLTPSGNAVIRNDGSSSGTSAPAASDNNTKEEDADQDQGNSSSGGTVSSGDLIHIGFAQVGAESGWRLAQTASMKETFTEENGYLFDFVDCNNDQKKQIETISQFIADGVEYIVIDPIVEDGYDDVLKEAQDAGIPVIVVDRNISADPSLYACWVGSDFAQEGTDAAEWLKGYLEENGRGSEQINMLTILGSDGSSAMKGRTEGMDAAVEANGNWNMLDKQSGDFTEDGGYAVMKAFLKQYDDIDVVVCQNDDEAFGAITAIQEAGKTCGVDGDIIIISFDATKAGFERMVAGEINVDVECNPLEGPFVAELIQKLKAGESIEAIQYMEEGVFPAETAADVIDSRVY